MERLITLTEERLNKAKTIKGGYNKKQLQILNIEWPPNKGWKKELMGKTIPLFKFIKFVKAGKNVIYLREIEESLPHLNPPIVELETNIQPASNKVADINIKLNKKELKRERTEAKRVRLRAIREEKIRAFGIHKSVSLIKEKAKSALPFHDSIFINDLLQKEESEIDSSAIHRVYTLMKKVGVVLSVRRSGKITSSGFTQISKTREKQFLYVIRETESENFKIGISVDPRSRLKSLQTSNANRLKISMVFETKENAVKLERKLHKHFAKHRKSGEWFTGISDNELRKVISDNGTITKYF